MIREFTLRPELGVEPVISADVLNHKIPQGSLVKFRTLWTLLILSMRPQRSAESADLIHHTFYLPGLLSRLPDAPKVVTLFDMIPENTRRGLRFWNPHFCKRAFLSRASAVISISNFSTKDMRKQYELKGYVPTIYLGVGPEFKPGLTRPQHENYPYFLYVGNRSGYKDCETALRAFATVIKTNSQLRLILIGGGRLSLSERQVLRRLGLQQNVEQKEVTSEELPSYYSNALALLYPSRYEGFGLPLVEAMASGLSVLASAIDVNKEICEGNASYFLPGNDTELSKLMGIVVSGATVMSDKIQGGLMRAGEFTWSRCAEETAKIYMASLNQR